MATLKSSPITSRSPLVDFTNRFVQPPSPLYVFRDDLLFIRSQSNSANRELRLRGRLLTPDGQIVTLEFVHTTGTDGFNPGQQTFNLQEGFFLGIAIIPLIATGSRGEIFVTVGLTRGGTEVSAISQILFAGYIEGFRSPSWPSLFLESSTDGQGRFLRFASAVPAAGAEISFTLIDNHRTRPICIALELTTDATAINRFVHLDIIEGGTRIALMPPDIIQVASEVRAYTASHHGGLSTALGVVGLIPLPEHLILSEGDVIATSTTNIQAGDQYAAAQMFTEQWLVE